MPAKSRSQQRLFGMVHAYNKGEFHGSRSLRKRIAALSKHISDTDAAHFAKTQHDGLPEKAAQLYLRPEDVQHFYSQIPDTTYDQILPNRAERRRSLLGSAARGMTVGSAALGLGAGTLGAFLAHRAARSTPGLSSAAVAANMGKAGLRCGLWGLGRGALLGAITGIGLNVIDRMREAQ